VTFSLIFNIEKFVSCGSSCRLKLVLRLPQDLKPSISYLSSKELEFVRKALQVSSLLGKKS